MDVIKRHGSCSAGRRPGKAARAALAVLLTCTVSVAVAQQASPTDFQAYPLRHVQAGDIRPVLVSMLPLESEIVADHQSNRLLIRGSAESHRVASEVIRSLDQTYLAQVPPSIQPTGPIPPTPPPTPPVTRPTGPARSAPPFAGPSEPLAEGALKAYRVTPSQAPGVMSSLQRQFGRVPGFRMVFDERTSQIVVTAPATIQTQIAAHVRQISPPENPMWRAPGAPDVVGANTRRQLQLRHTTSAELESRLTGVFGDRLGAIGGQSTHTAAYRLSLAGGASLDLSFDRQAQRIGVTGPARAVESCARMIVILDHPEEPANRGMGLVSLRTARMADVRKTVDAVNTGASAGQVERRVQLARNFQQPAPGGSPPDTPGAGIAPEAMAQPVPAGEGESGLVGPVQVEIVEGLDVIILKGNARDVAQVEQLIQQIEQLSIETEPVILVHHLLHVDCSALEEMVTALYEEVFSARRGTISITALVKPNALLLIGRQESVDTVVDLVKRLDRPVEPQTQFQVFRLEHAAADSAQETIEEFFDEREGLGTKVGVIADFRSNSLIVQASPRDLVEVAAMIEKLDVGDSSAVNEMRLIKLEHTLAGDIQPVLEEAITGGGAAQQGDTERSAALRFVTIDAEGQRLLRSGILTDVRITADENSNALLVSAPAASMPLIEALIEALDQLPAAESQIKVFTIAEGDATTMMEMLETLFGTQTGTQQIGQTPVRTGAVEGESSLVQLRFAVDARTNSIIATGSMGDLIVVESILLRLDESDVRDRTTTVVRLNNAPAEDVSIAINEYLDSQQQLQQIEEGLSVFEQMEREVIVVPEVVSNSLIISATPRYFDDIMDLVDQLDQPPPMVMIQVLIAEVQLSDTDEFGVELGLQDSILFDRSLLGNIVTTQESRSDPATGIVTTTENISSATIDPGFLFNNGDPLGNSGASSAAANSGTVGGQGLSNFAVGRLNSELGFGGLVLSASSEAVSILIRALQEKRRVDILSRPQIMTLDNQPAFVMVGQRVPRITGVQTNQTGQTNDIVDENVGLILTVTPRISPEGTVVMEIDVDKSDLGPDAEGIPVSVSEGQVIRSPRINTTTAQTTVSASDGQTVLLGGLITKNKSTISRRVPGLAQIPILGQLFRFDSLVSKRTELLIIMTPHIVDSEEDADWILQSEAERMHWCLCDLAEFPETEGLRSRSDEWSDAETTTIYPEDDPELESVAPPESAPLDLETPPTTQSGRRLPTMAPPPEQEAKSWWGPSVTVDATTYQARHTAQSRDTAQSLPRAEPGATDRAGPAHQPPRTPPIEQPFYRSSEPAKVGLEPLPPLDGFNAGVRPTPPSTMEGTSPWRPGREAVAPATYQPWNPAAPGADRGILPAYDVRQTAWPQQETPQVRTIAPPREEVASHGWPPANTVQPATYRQQYSTPQANIISVTPAYGPYQTAPPNVAGPMPQAPAYDRPQALANRQSADSPFLNRFYRLGSRPSGMAGGYIDASGRRLY